MCVFLRVVSLADPLVQAVLAVLRDFLAYLALASSATHTELSLGLLPTLTEVAATAAVTHRATRGETGSRAPRMGRKDQMEREGAVFVAAEHSTADVVSVPL